MNALVQRKRRRMHVASIRPGDTHWLTACDLEVLAAGATFWAHDAIQVADEHADSMCVHCRRIVLAAAYLAEAWHVPTREAVAR